MTRGQAIAMKSNLKIEYGVTNDCLRYTLMKRIAVDPKPCFLLPDGQLCDVCSDTCNSSHSVEIISNTSSLSLTRSLMEDNIAYLATLVEKIEKSIYGPSYFKDNCLLCFLFSKKLSSLKNNQEAYTNFIETHQGHQKHREWDCADPFIITICPCNDCLGANQHSALLECGFFKKHQTGLCWKCYMPQMIGKYYLHSPEEFGQYCRFGPILRTCYIFRLTIANHFKLGT